MTTTLAPEASTTPAPATRAGPGRRFAKDQLRAFVARIEKLEEEKRAIADDIKDVFTEAKGNGYDTKALRAVIRLRKQDPDERAEQEAILQTYMDAIGFDTTPLGAAMRGDA